MKIYKYGMKYRGFAPGCQPLQNLIEAQEDPTNKFYNILLYSEPLTPEEIRNYQLIDMQPAPDYKKILIDFFRPYKSILKTLNEYTRNTAATTLLNLIKDYAGQDHHDDELIKLLENAKSTPGEAGPLYEIIDFLIINMED